MPRTTAVSRPSRPVTAPPESPRFTGIPRQISRVGSTLSQRPERVPYRRESPGATAVVFPSYCRYFSGRSASSSTRSRSGANSSTRMGKAWPDSSRNIRSGFSSSTWAAVATSVASSARNTAPRPVRHPPSTASSGAAHTPQTAHAATAAAYRKNHIPAFLQLPRRYFRHSIRLFRRFVNRECKIRSD